MHSWTAPPFACNHLWRCAQHSCVFASNLLTCSWHVPQYDILPVSCTSPPMYVHCCFQSTCYLFPLRPPIVTVHTYQGRKKLPNMEVPIQQGKVNLAPVLSTYPLTLEKTAVSDSSLSKPSYEPLESLSVPAQPGQHVYVVANSTGMLSEGCHLHTAVTGHARVVTLPPSNT